MPQNAKGNIANGTAIAQNTSFFTNGLTPSVVGPAVIKFRITMAVSTTGCILNCTIDNSHYELLNSGVALTQNAEYVWDIELRSGDTFNLQASNASGCTIILCRIDEIVDED